uniref:hypothetical protein n=1 Tax=Streptococcus pneumoniae TaxID=1313 RepID=UPI001240460C
MSCSFSDSGRFLSASSACSIFFFNSSGRVSLLPTILFSEAGLAFSVGNSSKTSVALIAPLSIASSKSSLPIAALAA